MLRRAEPFLRQRVQSWGSGVYDFRVTMEDTGGEDEFETIENAEASFIGTRHRLDSVTLWARESTRERMIRVGVRNVSSPRTTPKWMVVYAEGPDEADVVGLVTVTAQEVRAARKEAASVRRRAWLAVVNHPYTVQIVGGVMAGAVILAVTIWLT